ncbi:MAG: precorrin-3B synthase [Ilumatobacteraceae bacterium]|nr:precorrin-3B synthase [Ilumatobacteraceae bacterium]
MPAVVPFRTRGACPGVFDPMESGDGWLVRVRLPGGALPAADMRTVAAIARTCGSGAIDLTSRANLQLRGLSASDLEHTGAALVGAGLARPDGRLDAMRAIVASPLTGRDPTATVDATPVVTAIEQRLVADVAGELPSKFVIVVDDGGAWPLEHLDADVTLRARPGGAEWLVAVRGAATPIGITADPCGAAGRVANACVTASARMDAVARALEPRALLELLAVGPLPTSWSGDHRSVATMAVTAAGVLPHLDPAQRNVVAAPFLGRLDASTMDALAAIAERNAAEVRVTTGRSLAICDIPCERVDQLVSDLRGLDLIVAADDPRALLSGCVGSRGCRSAHADTTVFAHALVAAGGSTGAVHVSGCGKCCGAPVGPASLVLVANEHGQFAPRGDDR